MIHGSNPTLMSVKYIKPNKKSGIKECFEVVYRDDSGVLHKSYEPAEATIYFTKPEFRDHDYNKPTELMEKLYPHRTTISKIKFDIAEEIGEEGAKWLRYCFDNREYRSLDKLYAYKYSYRADFQPEFYFMDDWYKQYELSMKGITKGFIDIELDILNINIDLDNLVGAAYASVNLITVFMEETKECFTMIRSPKRPSELGLNKELYDRTMKMYESQLKQHEELLKNLELFKLDLHDRFDKTYGSDIKYHIRVYDKEIDLITDCFSFINSRKPNFMLAWNMRFDMQYLVERIKFLGYDPISIIPHPDFDRNKRCYYRVDRMAFELTQQSDFFHCSSYSMYICQMRLFGAIRKSQAKLRSLRLDYIGDRVLKDKKVEYPANTSVAEFPYSDWKLFIIYNIKDVLLQVGIERKSMDVESLYFRSHSNLTPYEKAFRETHLLRNVREKYFNKDGWVQGNNLNIIGGTDASEELGGGSASNEKVTFKGAIMADPMMNDNVGEELLGSPTNYIFNNAIDYDMAGFYPGNKISSNMGPETLLYKASFINGEFISGDMSNKSLNVTYSEKDKNGQDRKVDNTGEAVNTYMVGDMLSMGYNYLNLPTITELYEELQKQ